MDVHGRWCHACAGPLEPASTTSGPLNGLPGTGKQSYIKICFKHTLLNAFSLPCPHTPLKGNLFAHKILFRQENPWQIYDVHGLRTQQLFKFTATFSGLCSTAVTCIWICLNQYSYSMSHVNLIQKHKDYTSISHANTKKLILQTHSSSDLAYIVLLVAVSR